MDPAILVDSRDAPQHPSTSTQHKYGTRTRQNSLMRPSARLRQSPDLPAPQPRKIRPAGPLKHAGNSDSRATTPKFPPDNVVLHPEDATSKVFLAIGRSFMAIDNRALTIKDLAEMSVSYGIGSQNVSAASQAITTYIRNHMRRCDEEQDHPLLLRHTLSGTPSDDELFPALHSRAGGAHCGPGLAENRLTNFRKGTVVWYLSKAAGAPCPFTRAGIRVCDYTENGKTGAQAPPKDPRERRRERDRARRAAQCGDKRKRLARACASRESDSESDSESEPERPPPKVKLTLRLKPSVTLSNGSPTTPPPTFACPVSTFSSPPFADSSSEDSDDDSMAVDSSDDDEEEAGSAWAASECPVSLPTVIPSSPNRHSANYDHSSTAQPSGTSSRRSPSVPQSVASAPPDSEEEDDDFHISMTGRRRSTYADMGLSDDDSEWPFDLDGYADEDADDDTTDTTWGDSPDPLSPPPLIAEDVVVKVEQTDVRGMLDAWDDLDKRVADSKVVEIVARAAADAFKNELAKSTPDPLSTLQWEQYGHPSPGWDGDIDDDEVDVKEEDGERDLSPESVKSHQGCLSSPIMSFASLSLQSPSHERAEVPFKNERRPSLLTWQDVELLGPDSVHLKEFEDGEWPQAPSLLSSICERAAPSGPCTTSSPYSSTTSELYESTWSDSTSSLVTSLSATSQLMTPSDSMTSSVATPSTMSRFLVSMNALAKELVAGAAPSSKSHAAPSDPPTASKGLDGRAKLSSKRDSSSSIQTIVPQTAISTPWEQDMLSLEQVEEDLLLANAPFPQMDALRISAPEPPFDAPVDTPLSPTEQEMFLSLCIVPEDLAPEAKDVVMAVPVASENDDAVEIAEDAIPVPDRPLRRSTRLAGTRPRPRTSARGASSTKRSSK